MKTTKKNLQEYGFALFFYGAITGILTQLVDKTASLQFNAVILLMAIGIFCIGMYSIAKADKVVSSLGGR